MPSLSLHSRVVAVATSLLLGAALSACGGAGGAATNADGDTVIRYQSYVGMLNVMELADALGYLDEADIELDRVGDVQGGPEGLRALTTDQVDVAGAFQGAIAKVVSTGAPITAVLAYYGSHDDVNFSFVVRQGDDIEGPRDLIGKKVAVNTLGANAEAVLDTYLAEGGLTEKEIAQVTLVPLPGTVSEASLRKKQVDAAFMSGSARDYALQRPGLDVLFSDVEVVGPYNGGGLALHDRFIQENPGAVGDLVGALAKAVVWSQDHSVEEVRDLIGDYLEEDGRGDQKEALGLWRGTGVSTEGGVLRDEDFSLWLDWLVAAGEIKKGSVEVDDIYTNEFNPYAKEK
ncbi:ABC transporter substrate-binding protein [Nocardioides jishulii]|uniref:ABC transporter substrate-binding protein n=1 Tax=Nocardioides jishulii TaxID=2575440 RepID=A0A4U2YUY6_9ACTN|nr:ABC transporter substrate-binding protein [Nocardioides jishulii]QCX26285.1 ABC transporter substrate-binding protein [Nocardioides jishulii]TKI63911.1 ABC transporter substrate-binding protein [Nocardioides jishulii]